MRLIELVTQILLRIWNIIQSRLFGRSSPKQPIPLSVNYHLTRACNYRCKFCFHTALTNDRLPLDEAKHGLRLLYKAGTKKINFSGGEPFLIDQGTYVGELTRFAKEECQMATSIVSNGSLIFEKWFETYSKYLDILAISCDSFDDECNRQAGRTNGHATHSQISHVRRVRDLCYKYNVIFKINSVIHKLNYQEDMTCAIEELEPVRWKVFQCLLIEGENMGGEKDLRDARELVISDEQFGEFSQKHKHLKCFVPESNLAMRNSYLILDENMRFLDCTKGRKDPSPSILDVGVEAALDRSGFDEKMFFERGGQYKWTKDPVDLNDW
jgi:radical S-adenosyl methionine domain-containing protein 2